MLKQRQLMTREISSALVCPWLVNPISISGVLVLTRSLSFAVMFSHVKVSSKDLTSEHVIGQRVRARLIGRYRLTRCSLV